jgi:hypothetical protein
MKSSFVCLVSGWWWTFVKLNYGHKMFTLLLLLTERCKGLARDCCIKSLLFMSVCWNNVGVGSSLGISWLFRNVNIKFINFWNQPRNQPKGNYLPSSILLKFSKATGKDERYEYPWKKIKCIWPLICIQRF